MKQSIILITHDADDLDDRASLWLARQGFALKWSCPAAGRPIPPLTEDIVGVVIYGGAPCVDEQERYPFLKDELRFIGATLKRGVPFLGICLGAQLLAHALGRHVGPHPRGFAEYGYYDIMPTDPGRAELGDVPKALQSHFHGWYETPKGAVALARSEAYPEQAFRYGENAYAIQFHPEASRAMLKRWIGRRPPERHAMPGAHPPDRQLADNLVHDKTLGDWFDGFLGRWMPRAAAYREAAE
jgi:GMP synthase (glutamine-hydrolysing)